MKKQCSKCHTKREYKYFFKNKGCKDGLGSWCKPCQALYNGSYYKSNKSVYRARLKRYRLETKAKIDALKKSPCLDCKNTFPPVCMDFDHVKGKKLFDIASYGALSSAMGWNRIQKEITKCELVCANCHRIRTQSRR